MRKWLLRNFQSPGDILMLTAAVRDLHLGFPGQFQTQVQTTCPQLWDNNPHLTAFDENDREVEVVDCHYPLIHQANRAPYHFVQGFIEFLNQRLHDKIELTAFKGDIHLSKEEKESCSPVAELAGVDAPYWIIVAGGKFDFTIKWWHFRRYQQVVDHFRDRTLFVQVGEAGHFHPELNGVIDLRGKTSARELIRLVYHAEGVLCPVTFLMHLAAAVETRPDRARIRPCVVVAGGREPPHWEAYPHHQFIHTIGSLACCATGGCWRTRTVPLGDGDEKDSPEALCVNVANDLPRCMDLITPEEVISRIDLYYSGGVCRHLSRNETDAVRPFLKPSLRELLQLKPTMGILR
jgi:ADP-heptose:LPS heptosyltransferase